MVALLMPACAYATEWIPNTKEGSWVERASLGTLNPGIYTSTVTTTKIKGSSRCLLSEGGDFFNVYTKGRKTVKFIVPSVKKLNVYRYGDKDDKISFTAPKRLPVVMNPGHDGIANWRWDEMRMFGDYVIVRSAAQLDSVAHIMDRRHAIEQHKMKPVIQVWLYPAHQKPDKPVMSLPNGDPFDGTKWRPWDAPSWMATRQHILERSNSGDLIMLDYEQYGPDNSFWQNNKDYGKAAYKNCETYSAVLPDDRDYIIFPHFFNNRFARATAKALGKNGSKVYLVGDGSYSNNKTAITIFNSRHTKPVPKKTKFLLKWWLRPEYDVVNNPIQNAGGTPTDLVNNYLNYFASSDQLGFIWCEKAAAWNEAANAMRIKSGIPPVDYNTDPTPDDLVFVDADFDKDGDVDGVDFGVFSSCYNGAGNPPKSGCTDLSADFDQDGDIDGVDAARFSSCHNGAGKTPRCN